MNKDLKTPILGQKRKGPALPHISVKKEDGTKKTEEEIEEELNLTAFQLKERRARTVFVGNLPLDTQPEMIKKHFREFGKIEKIWFRSHAIDPTDKAPAKAKIIKKDFSEKTKNSKNGYILFETIEEAEKAATQVKNLVIGEKHVRVGTDNPEKKDQHDFERTLFVGNLPWVVEEEEIRRHFEKMGGKVEDVRVIRDPNTQIGKGFCYVRMVTVDDMKKIMNNYDRPDFQKRELRIKKATPIERREKKQKKRVIKQEGKQEQHKQEQELLAPKPRKVFAEDAEDEEELLQEMRGKAGFDEATIKFMKQTAQTLQGNYKNVSVSNILDGLHSTKNWEQEDSAKDYD